VNVYSVTTLLISFNALVSCQRGFDDVGSATEGHLACRNPAAQILKVCFSGGLT